MATGRRRLGPRLGFGRVGPYQSSLQTDRQGCVLCCPHGDDPRKELVQVHRETPASRGKGNHRRTGKNGETRLWHGLFSLRVESRTSTRTSTVASTRSN